MLNICGKVHVSQSSVSSHIGRWESAWRVLSVVLTGVASLPKSNMSTSRTKSMVVDGSRTLMPTQGYPARCPLPYMGCLLAITALNGEVSQFNQRLLQPLPTSSPWWKQTRSETFTWFQVSPTSCGSLTDSVSYELAHSIAAVCWLWWQHAVSGVTKRFSVSPTWDMICKLKIIVARDRKSIQLRE